MTNVSERPAYQIGYDRYYHQELSEDAMDKLKKIRFDLNADSDIR